MMIGKDKKMDIEQILRKELRMVSVKDLEVDPEYQRDPSQSSSLRNKMAKEWNWVQYDPIMVNERDGKYYIIDGQNRKIVLEELGVEYIPVWLIMKEEVSTRADEAGLFVGLNKDINPVKQLDIFNAALTQGHPKALDMRNIATKYGIQFKRNSGDPYSTVAVKSFEKAYDLEQLDTTLEVITTVWDGNFDEKFLNNWIVQGVATFLGGMWHTRGDTKVRPSKITLMEALKEQDVTPEKILRRASTIKLGATGDNWRLLVASTLMEIYNRKRRGNNVLIRMVNQHS